MSAEPILPCSPAAGFESSVESFIAATKNLIGQESREDRPPCAPGPALSAMRGVPSGLRLDEETTRRYSHSIGESNPLYTDPIYAGESCHGGLLAPGPVLVHVRYPADHGADRPGGYPVANFIAGVAWEFHDIVRVGTRFSSSKVLREVVERRGANGRRLIVLVTEIAYWDAAGELKAKAYGSLIQVPMPSMGSSRTMDPVRLGDELLYRRNAHRYDEQTTEAIVSALTTASRRGATPRWWDEVNVGDELGPLVQPPYEITDEIAYQSLRQGLFGAGDGTRLCRAFGPAFRAAQRGWGHPDHARCHPVTRWPHTPGDEHEDVHLAPFRGVPLPFDFGVQRAQIPHRLLTDWAGDAGFVNRMYTAMRRPVLYGDATWYHGRVTGKQMLRAVGCDTNGGIAGEARYGAVTISITGANQRGEVHCEGHARVLLPTRADGPPRLPVPHAGRGGHVPLALHRSSAWCEA